MSAAGSTLILSGQRLTVALDLSLYVPLTFSNSPLGRSQKAMHHEHAANWFLNEWDSKDREWQSLQGQHFEFYKYVHRYAIVNIYRLWTFRLSVLKRPAVIILLHQ